MSAENATPSHAAPRVFISYSHDAPDHRQRVKAIADQLRSDGIPCMIDAYVSPSQGWRTWMREQIEQADRVLMVFSPTYKRRFEKNELPGQGKGVTFEGAVIGQLLYDEHLTGDKFRVLLMEGTDPACISAELRDLDYYRPEMPLGYETLFRFLVDRGPAPPPLGPLRDVSAIAANDLHPAGPVSTPSAPAPAPSALPRAYETWLATFRTDCEAIPIFGNIRPAIPMEHSFINLRLTEQSRGSGADVRAPHQLRLRDAEEKDDGPSPALTLKAEDLWLRYPKGLIVGLPGAGKTTILRHFAHLALKAAPAPTILFIPCRSLSAAHFPAAPRHLTGAALLAFRLRQCARALLQPVLADGSVPPETPDTAALAAALLTAWQEHRAVLLIDALDEAPDVHTREAIIAAAADLLHAIPAPASAPLQPLSFSLYPSSNRLFLTARRNEYQRLQNLHESLFEVKPLDQDEMRLFARHLFGEHSDTFLRFDDYIWREPVLQATGRTPLTALLLLCYFDIFHEFQVRWHTYDLILRFVLNDVWDRVKSGWEKTDAPHDLHHRTSAHQFFLHVSKDDFLQQHPQVRLRYQALSELCCAVLYDGLRGTTAREFSTATALAHFHAFLEQQPGVDDARTLAQRWFDDFHHANLFIAASHDRWVFVHSTIMEFLAARHLAPLLRESVARHSNVESSPAPDAHATLESRATYLAASPGGDDPRDSLECLPIACGCDDATASAIFAALQPFADGKKDRAPLVFRCLAETETSEFRRLEKLDTRASLARLEKDLAPREERRAWAYTLLASLITGATAGSSSAWEEKIKDGLRLPRPVLARQCFAAWLAHTAVLPSVQMDMLKLLLTKDYMEEWQRAETTRLEEASLAASRTARPGPAKTAPESSSLLTLDRPGDPNDKRFGYYRSEGILFSRHGEEPTTGAGHTLAGFFGSPLSKDALAIWCCAFSPDGQRLLSGSSDMTLRLWHANSGRELRSLTGHSGRVWACAFSPDGQHLLSSSDDKTLRLWHADSGRELRSLTGHSGYVMACVFSPDGQTLLSGSDDHTLRLWHADSGQKLHSLTGHSDYVRACAFSPDGRALLSGSDDKTLRLWHADSGRAIRSLTGHSGYVRACAFSPDGQTLLSGSNDHTLRLWHADSGQKLHSLTGHSGYVRACAFSPDGQRLFSGSADRTLRLWHAATGRELARWQFPWEIYAVAWQPTQPNLVAASGDNGTVTLIDVDAEP